MFEVLATTVLVVHFAFLAYVVLGGFLAWRWPKAFWPHLAAAVWGLTVVTFSLRCPLTAVEHWARRRAGQGGVERGFIDQYIEGVLYPARYTHYLQVLVGVVVVGSYAGLWVKYRNRRDTTRRSEEMSEPPATV
ncbi:DUF2784 domain-containing protein [Dactylosporangium roseum]|uniref:DUF2784 domain-containing protein n=1 Tax=Dactylosporangium roseum TaxID=47989 RepID=A0ABY5Z843_9ACTN|nr:DUF2784 domain-containing protein [Dactylosporangium roseum]UWZ38260.1 DUF2784 domain-containing protein [Dactylosporangium roseum]